MPVSKNRKKHTAKVNQRKQKIVELNNTKKRFVDLWLEENKKKFELQEQLKELETESGDKVEGLDNDIEL